jgi:RNA polymerase sigma factor (sigma-70 family)
MPSDAKKFEHKSSRSDKARCIGEYLVLDEIGSGGMGIVFKARPRTGTVEVALKLMKRDLALCAAARTQFLHEARMMQSIQADQVVKIYDVGEHKTIPFFVMELLRGESLAHRLKREGKLPIYDVARIGKGIAEGLRIIHAHDLVHRDIKPANIWLEENSSRVLILDFGLAAVADASELGPSLVGTAAYMAPEQTLGQAADPRFDLFSLGCIYYQLSTGELPFRGGNVAAMIHAVRNHDPRDPSSLNAAVPNALSKVIKRLLAKDPQQRFQSATEVLAALADFERSEAVQSSERRPASVLDEPTNRGSVAESIHAVADPSSFTSLLSDLQTGRRDAAAEIFKRFSRRLIQLTKARLSKPLRAKVDAEDVVQSVFRSFFRVCEAGEFHTEDQHGLWAFLVLIAVRKCADQVERFHTAMRDLNREVNESHGLALEVLAREPLPEESAQLSETIERLVLALPAREKDILLLGLEGYSATEIAQQMQRSERTVRRALLRIREELQKILEG